jgi:hypothetical protein
MFKVGDTVLFGRTNGEKTRGRVTKVNSKSYKVTTLESRGTRSQYTSGGSWRVPHSLVWHDSPSMSTTYRRAEKEVLNDIGSVYASLSPENLHCDGEISHSAAMAKARGLNARLKTLFKELGREVSEYEACSTFR